MTLKISRQRLQFACDARLSSDTWLSAPTSVCRHNYPRGCAGVDGVFLEPQQIIQFRCINRAAVPDCSGQCGSQRGPVGRYRRNTRRKLRKGDNGFGEFVS